MTQRRRRLQLTVGRGRLVVSALHDDRSPFDVRRTEVVRLGRGGAVVVISGAGRQAAAAQDGRERRPEVGVHPAVQKRIDAARPHRDDAQHQVDEAEVRAAHEVPVELGNDAVQLVGRPGDGEHDHDSGQHPVGARHAAPTSGELGACADVSEHEQVEYGDEEQRQEVLEHERHDRVDFAHVARRPVLETGTPAEPQHGIGVDHEPREDGERQGDHGGEGCNDQDEDEGDGRRQATFDADDDEREPIDGDDRQ